MSQPSCEETQGLAKFCSFCETNPFVIEGQVIPPSSTYPACLAEWFPTHPQADYTFAKGWNLHAHCFFSARALRRFEAQNYIFTNWIARVNCPTFAIFRYCFAFTFLAEHTFPPFHCFWLEPLNPGADFLQGFQARILELGVTTAMPTPILFNPSTAEGCHLELLLPPQDLEVFPPVLLAPCNIISLVSAPPPPKVDFPAELAAATSVSTTTRVRMPPKAIASVGTLPVSPKVTRSALHFEARPHKVVPKQPLILLKTTCHAATSKSTRSASDSSSNGEVEEEEDELEPSSPKCSTVSCKRCRPPSMASSNPSEVSSPESEASIAKKIPATRSTVAKANQTSNPKGKQKARACSTSPEISAPVKGRPPKRPRTTVIIKEEVKPTAKVKKNGKKANPADFTDSSLFPPWNNLEDFPSLQVDSKGLVTLSRLCAEASSVRFVQPFVNAGTFPNNTLPLNLQVPFFNIEPCLSDLGVALTHDHVGYTLEELQLVNRPLDLLGSDLVSCIPCQIRNIKCSPNTERLGGKCAPCIMGKQPCNLGRGMAEYLEVFREVLSEAQWLHVIHGQAIDISHHHQELVRQIEYDFLTTMARLQSARSDAAIVLHQLVQSAPERAHFLLNDLSFLAMAFGWNWIFNLPELSASLEVRNQLLNVGNEDEPAGSPVDLSSGEPSGSGSAQVLDAVALGVEANT
ncbi:hypothetical protein BT96DRAFT_1074032 [Gymnopus androsaceus JB14]|uniref:Uncharacterized protein n=1 Tax=Gymnopus androsaceus JB14 TaxID=1447944 RepID=A0A6A4GSK3_9AGAR|nr:hypothetical protein BT96DRAFT_1074032 [Gymnopus androsaceus JB14]